MDVRGRLIVVPGDDIDTDRIMPARFLKAITFSGLEAHLFEDDRRALRERGGVHPFDEPGAKGASILVAGANFGCGSSREHAPQALSRWGITAVLAPSFGEIFVGNSTAIGLVCASISPAAVAQIAEDPSGEWVVDLHHMILGTGHKTHTIDMPASRRHALQSGEWDATGLLLANYDEVERVDTRLPYLRATSRNA